MPLIFLAFAALIMAPLYTPGFVFLTDMVAGPRINLAEMIRNGIGPSLPLNFLLYLLNFLIPGEILQKIVLTGVLFLPGYAMHRLASRYMNKWLAVGSGLMYMINPYVYERLLVGHWVVLLGYGFFPFALLALIRFFELSNWRRFIVFGVVFSLYPLISLHWAYIASGFFMIYGIVVVVQRRYRHACPSSVNEEVCHSEQSEESLKSVIRDPSLRLRTTDNRRPSNQTIWRCLTNPPSIKIIILLIVTFFLINSFWFLNFFAPTQTLAQIGLGDFKAFSTLSDPQLGVYFNVLSLYGIWDTNSLTPKDFLSFWWLVTLIVLIFTALGAYRELRRGSSIAWAVCLAFIPALLLAVGYGSAFTRPIINFLYYAAPFFRGLRDTAKITGLLAFAYAFLVPLGLEYVYLSMGRLTLSASSAWWRFLPTASVMVIPFLWAGSLLWGAHGQILPFAYPSGWYSAETVLKAERPMKVVFLPWHAYLKLNFANDALVANPATGFFSETMITGRDTDNRFLAAAEKSPRDAHVLTFTDNINPADLDFLRSEGVTHIVVAKTDDWERFFGLYKSSYLEKIFDDESMTVFRVK